MQMMGVINQFQRGQLFTYFPVHFRVWRGLNKELNGRTQVTKNVNQNEQSEANRQQRIENRPVDKD